MAIKIILNTYLMRKTKFILFQEFTNSLLNHFKSKRHFVTFLIFQAIIYSSIYSQDSTLHIIARPLPDSILIRWAPSDYKTWQLGNQYGYIVERYTILRDSSLVKDTEKRILTSSPLKPLGLYDWEPLAKTNKYAIAAEAIYEETFKIDDGESFNPQNVWNKSIEQQPEQFNS